jgi:hypothetical protein
MHCQMVRVCLDRHWTELQSECRVRLLRQCENSPGFRQAQKGM